MAFQVRLTHKGDAASDSDPETGIVFLSQAKKPAFCGEYVGATRFLAPTVEAEKNLVSGVFYRPHQRFII